MMTGELEALKAAARQRLAAGQGELDLGLALGASPGGPLEIASSRMGHLHDALCRAYDRVGFGQATRGDEVFKQLVLARIIEPTSKQDSLRVLAEAGVDAASYPTLNRRLPVYAKEAWRRQPSAACAAHAVLGRPHWCFTACPRCISRPIAGTGSGSRGSPRNAAWTRRSPSAC
jgi:hypothetical protein